MILMHWQRTSSQIASVDAGAVERRADDDDCDAPLMTDSDAWRGRSSTVSEGALDCGPQTSFSSWLGYALSVS